MDRRRWMTQVAAMAVAGTAASRSGRAAEPEVDPEVLRTQLTQGLRVTTDEQREYINRVVTLVANKTLSATMVYAVFKWARRRYPRLPFVYFRRALDLLAKKQGIII